MATVEQLTRVKENLISILWPLYGPMGKKEGTSAKEVGHWWAEVLGDYEPHALSAAAQWWKGTDVTGYWPRTPAVVKEWLDGQGYRPRPSRALPPPPADPLGNLRAAASAFYTGMVVGLPPEVLAMDIPEQCRYMFNRKDAFDALCRRYQREHPEALAILNLKEEERPNWGDVMALAVRDGALCLSTMLAEVEVLHAAREARRNAVGKPVDGLGKTLGGLVAGISHGDNQPTSPQAQAAV